MTKRNKVLAGAGAAALLASGGVAAFAQDRPLPMDANGDSQLTTAEINQATAQRFAAFDVDKNGKLEGAEIQLMRDAPRGRGPGRGGRRGRGDMAPPAAGAAPAAVENDFDGDGAISLDEYSRGTATRFILLDANKDGTITADEFRSGFRDRRGGRDR